MLKLRDNVYGAINATIGTGDSRSTATIALASGDAARIPPLSAADFTYLDLINQAGQIERWLVHAVSTASNHIVASGAQLGTVPRAFASGDKFELRFHSGMVAEMEFLGGIKSHLTIGGTANALTASIVTRSPSIPDGFEVTGMATAENTDNVTFALTLDSTTLGGAPLATGAKSVRDDLGEQLGKAAISGNKHMLRLKYSSANDWWVLMNPSYVRRAYRMARGVPNDFIRISGGNADGLGAQVYVYGDEHADNPADIQTYSRVVQAFLAAGGNFTVVKDADDSVILRITEDSLVSGTALATLANAIALADNKLLTAAIARNLPFIPKHIFAANRTAENTFVEQVDIGHGGVSFTGSFSGSGTLTITFSNSFNGTGYKVLLFGPAGEYLGSGNSEFEIVSASQARLNNADALLPSGLFWGMAFGDKASA